MSSPNKGAGKKRPGQGNAPRTTAPRRPVHKPVPSWSEAQWQAALPAVLSTLRLTLTDGQQAQLASYMVMLAHWNSTFNLTALRDPQDMLSHHLTDCLTVLAPLAQHLAAREATRPAADGAIKLLDVGSGGGLPGVVLAICCPQVQVTCVDTVGKKAAFIRQVAAELKLPNLKAEHARVEQLKGRYDLITSRAFASLLDFVNLTHALLADGAVWMAMKGKQPDEELAVLPSSVNVFHVEQLNVPGLDAQRCLVWMRPN
ncbi:MAG: 16S rRNA (guanine(527)-N(7))-methyltransferase RsmG [Aquabacterium sp.]